MSLYDMSKEELILLNIKLQERIYTLEHSNLKELYQQLLVISKSLPEGEVRRLLGKSLYHLWQAIQTEHFQSEGSPKIGHYVRWIDKNQFWGDEKVIGETDTHILLKLGYPEKKEVWFPKEMFKLQNAGWILDIDDIKEIK